MPNCLPLESVALAGLLAVHLPSWLGAFCAQRRVRVETLALARIVQNTSTSFQHRLGLTVVECLLLLLLVRLGFQLGSVGFF